MNKPVFDTLAGAQTWCLSQLVRAASDPVSPFRWPVFATATDDGASGRIMVLRAFDAATRQFQFWSDARSPKIAQLQDEPGGELVFFDRPNMIQMRARVRVSIVREGPVWQAAFDLAARGTLDDYSTRSAPGEDVPVPGSVSYTGAPNANFVALNMTMTTLDVLAVSRDGNKRAFMDWRSGRPVRSWRVP